MAQNENIQIAQQAIALLNARDLDRYVQLIDASYVGESELAPGPIQGPQGAKQQLNTILSAFPDLRIEVEQLLADGNTVVARVRATGTQTGTFSGIAPTGKTISWGACNVLEFRNGKVIRGRIYSDNASVLRQIGALSVPRSATAS